MTPNGRPPIPAATKAARKAEFMALFKRLNSDVSAAAKALGISPATVRTYNSLRAPQCPSAATIERLRRAVLTDLEAKEAAASAAARKAFQARVDFQQEIAV